MSKMPHIQLDRSICATAAILPGDPARVDAIAAFLSDVREEGFSREYKSLTGTYKGRRILAISTGMGGASTAICVEELADLGFTDLIRIGSCGALQSHLSLGQLVLCDRAVCDDGTSQTYTNYLRYAAAELNHASLFTAAAPAQPSDPSAEVYVHIPDSSAEAHTKVSCFATEVHSQASDSAAKASGQASDSAAKASSQAPDSAAKASSLFETAKDSIQYACADPSLLHTCEKAAQELGLSYATGPTRCHDALYQRIKPMLDEFYSAKGIFASDMETAALFAVGALRGLRTASILNVVVEWKKDLKDGISSYRDGADAAAAGERNEILLALEALAR